MDMDGGTRLTYVGLVLFAVGCAGYVFTEVDIFGWMVIVAAGMFFFGFTVYGANDMLGGRRSKYKKADDLVRADDPTEQESHPGPFPPTPGGGL